MEINESQINLDWNEIEVKWKSKWEEKHLFESNYKEDQEKKYFITVAFPYPNSPQHIGHGRTYTLADVHARYKRMNGYNVLFPMGFHYTGTPILAMSKRVVSGDNDLIETFKNIYNVPENTIKTFSEPENIAKFFHTEIKLGMYDMGYSIDWRREFTTIDDLYSKFITWQFQTLRKKGLIVQGSHPVGWCPYDNNPVSQHDTLGDVEPEFNEYVLIKFKLLDNNITLPTATLRPETIFGVTNLWVNPDIEYVQTVVDQEEWIVTKEAAIKLGFLNHSVMISNIISGRDLIGKYVTDPIRNINIKILPAKFVKSDTGTGIVMSVPAHAPYDFQALIDLKKPDNDFVGFDLAIEEINPIKIITINETNYDQTSNLSIENIISRFNITSQNDLDLEKATIELYSLEYYKGKMLSITGKYSGMDVRDAKEEVKNDLLSRKNLAETYYELTNKPVKCRCGNDCVVKLLKDQWFINYADTSWKSQVHEYLNEIQIIPNDLRQEFHNVTDWLKERACARKSGLGTKLPWDPNWIIESLSDSVIYMAYYIISRFANSDRYSLHSNVNYIDNSFFDYILLGIGNVTDVAKQCNLSISLLEEIRKEFLYFYPVDSRHSGRDLIPNHLSFFLFNHIAIFDKKYWPLQIVVNGSVLMEGKKMSKSLGNIIPLRTAIKNYGADTIRLSILLSSELLQDADFSLETAKSIRSKLLEFYRYSKDELEVLNKDVTFDSNRFSKDISIEEYIYTRIQSSKNSLELEDKYFLSKLQRMIGDVNSSLETLRVRETLHNILYVLDQEIQWYKRRIRAKGRHTNQLTYDILLFSFIIRIKILSPFAPFITEEIWEGFGHDKSIAFSRWPQIHNDMIDIFAEESEELIKKLSTDLSNIIKVTKRIPQTIYIYCSSLQKQRIYNKILEIVELDNEHNFGNIMRRLLENPETSEAKNDPSLIKKMIEDILSESNASRINRLEFKSFDEFSVIEDASSFLSNEIEQKNTNIITYSEEDTEKRDPKSKSKSSRPFKPALYLE